jgi:hypothetical protein
VYAIAEGGRPRRILGDDVDHDIQMCPTTSPDGSRVAYLALDSTTITPTPAPVPEGQTPAPNPTDAGPLALWIEVVGLDASATPTGDARRIPVPQTDDGSVGCPRWSPDGTRLAFFVDLPDGNRDIIVAGLDGSSATVARGYVFDWEAGGRRLVVGDTAAWLVPVDGGPAQTLMGVVPNAVAWSPDGSRIALRTPLELLVVTPRGEVIFRQPRPQDDSPAVLWAPDGSRLAEAYGGRVHLTSPDGTASSTIDVDVAGLFPDATPDADFTPTIGLLAWSPDGRKLLLTASPMFDQNALITLGADGMGPPDVLLAPSLALPGMQPGQASWQAVHREALSLAGVASLGRVRSVHLEETQHLGVGRPRRGGRDVERHRRRDREVGEGVERELRDHRLGHREHRRLIDRDLMGQRIEPRQLAHEERHRTRVETAAFAGDGHRRLPGAPNPRARLPSGS